MTPVTETIFPMITYRVIARHELDTISVWIWFLHEYSRGWVSAEEVSAFNQIIRAEYMVGAFAENGRKLIGAGCVTRHASPDSVDSGELWLADFVVIPEYKKSLLVDFQLYQMCMAFAQTLSGRILMSAKSEQVCQLMHKLGWVDVRNTMDQMDVLTTVLEFPR